MRQFGDFEKNILKVIVAEKPETYVCNGKKYLSNTISRIMFEELGIISMSPITSHKYGHTIEVVFDEETSGSFSQLTDLVFLLRYLENSGLIGVSSFERVGAFNVPNYEKDESGIWGIKG